MRKPLITKKTSTPTYPPGIRFGQKWNSSTRSTASARNAWISGRTTPGEVCFESVTVPHQIGRGNTMARSGHTATEWWRRRGYTFVAPSR